MDRFTRTADIIKAYYSYKQTADSATFVKKVCSFFDFIKDESLSDADLNLLLFLANEAGIPQYYDLLKSKFTNAEIGDESINSLTMSALFHDASLIRGDSKLHRYQKHVLDSFVATQRNRYVLTAPTSFGKTFLVYEIIQKMQYQKKILQKYALDHGWKNIRFYIDDGISGTTFNRPGFQEMIADIEAGIVKRVIIKDMSRLGRDYLQVGMYTEIMFPEHDVHFIAVNDGVDSKQGDNEFTPFRNIINEWYAKDTSKKIRAVMKVKGNAGEHLTTNAPYGYMKDPANPKQWVRDNDAANVVYDIGLYVMDGYGPSQIARLLKQRKILTPAAYYESKGINCNVKPQDDPYGWNASTVAHILDRWREYLGHTVNFKTTKKSYKSKKKIQNPESEWVIFENTHEPIWTESIADAVRLARQTRRRPTKMGEMGMFSGMMFCADCGSIMYQCRATGFRREQEYYLCAGYRKSRDICGSTHSILTVILEELILQNLCKVVSYAREQEDQFVKMVMDMDEKERSKGLAKKKKLLTDAEKRISELDRIFKHLYEDNITGKLTDERFKKLSADYEAEQAALQTQANSLREEIQEEESKCANVERFLSIVRKYTEIPELTPHILHEFVEKIVVHAATDPHSKTNRKQEVDIYYKGIGILEMSKVFDIRQNEETA